MQPAHRDREGRQQHGERIASETGIDPRRERIDLDGMRASMGLTPEVLTSLFGVYAGCAPAKVRELCRTIAPLGIRWVGQASIHIAQDDELLRKMRRSGCAQILVGLEDPTDGTEGMRTSDQFDAWNGAPDRYDWKLIGKSVKVSMTPPGGTKTTLVGINEWDYNWQETYWLKEPLKLKAGTKVELRKQRKERGQLCPRAFFPTRASRGQGCSRS